MAQLVHVFENQLINPVRGLTWLSHSEALRLTSSCSPSVQLKYVWGQRFELVRVNFQQLKVVNENIRPYIWSSRHISIICVTYEMRQPPYGDDKPGLACGRVDGRHEAQRLHVATEEHLRATQRKRLNYHTKKGPLQA